MLYSNCTGRGVFDFSSHWMIVANARPVQPVGAFFMMIPKGLCQCGCGGKTSIARWSDASHGRIKGEPAMFIQHHFGMHRNPGHTADSSGCWNYNGYIAPSGYGGIVRSMGKPDVAHRAYYRFYRGEIPDGLFIDHLCRNRKCVNPYHLEAVTHGENVRRGASTKLNADSVAEMRRLRKTGLTCIAIAALFSLSPGHVSCVTTGRRWKN